MTRYWEPGTQYNHGDVVEYEGHRYKIIQPHSSQSDWAPDRTPALWGKLDDHDTGYEGGGGHHGGGHHESHQGGGEKHGGGWDQAPQQYAPPKPEGQDVDIHHEERKKSWWDLDDKRKKELEIGGGLLAGAAALGAGYFAYKEHNKNEEEKKALTWATQNWLHDAEARTEQYRREGLRGPAMWILNKGRDIPQQAILVGQEKSWNLYICRAFHEGSVQVGKASEAFKKGGVIGYGHDEIHLDMYEILIGDMRGLRWVDASGRLNVGGLGYKPVEGGRESDGTPLYIAKAPYEDAVHPGKASERLDGAMIPYDGSEKTVQNYQVLCYA